jgi:hypothetical protein
MASTTSADSSYKRKRLETVVTKPFPNPVKRGRGIAAPAGKLLKKPDIRSDTGRGSGGPARKRLGGMARLME